MSIDRRLCISQINWNFFYKLLLLCRYPFIVTNTYKCLENGKLIKPFMALVFRYINAMLIMLFWLNLVNLQLFNFGLVKNQFPYCNWKLNIVIFALINSAEFSLHIWAHYEFVKSRGVGGTPWIVYFKKKDQNCLLFFFEDIFAHVYIKRAMPVINVKDIRP